MSKAVKTVADALKKASTSSSADSTVSEKLTSQGLYSASSMKAAETPEIASNAINYIEREDVPDAVLQERAAEYAENKFQSNTQKTELDTQKKLNSLTEELQKTYFQAEQDALKNESDYADSLEKIADSAVRQGLARSSIFQGLNASATSSYEAQKAAIEREKELLAESIRTEMEIVESSRLNALRDYEIQKAADYEKKLAELRTEEMKARQEVYEFNKKMAELEADYEKNRQRTLAEWQDAIANGII